MSIRLLAALLTLLLAGPSSAAIFVGTAASPTTPSVELEITLDDGAEEITFVLRGPDDRWFAWGFGTDGMSGYSLIVEQDGGVTFHERNLVATGDPGAPQAQQDLSLVSSSSAGGVTELVLTRALDTGDANDFLFPAGEGTVELIWGRGGSSGAGTLAYHGPQNKGTGQDLNLTEDTVTAAGDEIATRSWGRIKMSFREVTP